MALLNPEHITTPSPCQCCGSTVRRFEIVAGHRARARCAKCGAFVVGSLVAHAGANVPRPIGYFWVEVAHAIERGSDIDDIVLALETIARKLRRAEAKR